MFTYDPSVTPWTVIHKTSLSMGFPRQEYWSGQSFPSPGDFAYPGVEFVFPPLQADSWPLSHCTHHKKQRHYFASKGLSRQGYGFSSSHVWIWELDYKESWTPKNWCFWTVVLEKTLESPLDCKEIQPVHPIGNQSWIFIGRTDVEAEAPILRPPDAKNWLLGKDLDSRKDWRQEEKGMTQDEIVGWHQWLNGYEFEQAPRDGEGQGGLACCSLWGCKESDMTERLNWTEPLYTCAIF